MAGLFGILKGPKDDACHDQFIKDLEAKLTCFASVDPDPQDVFSLLQFMYSLPLKYADDKMLYWMFMAVHTLAVDLVSRLDSKDAKALYDQYSSDYPKWERLPAQKNTLKALKKMI